LSIESHVNRQSTIIESPIQTFFTAFHPPLTAFTGQFTE